MIANRFDNPVRRRSRLFRCSALAWAVVFLLSGVRSAYAEIECPHHADGAHPAAGAAGAHPHGADHSLHHEHVHEHEHAAPTDPASGSEPHHDTCTCIGPCHLAGLAPLSVAVTTSPGAELLGLEPVQAASELEDLPGRPSYSLPFATAPPRGR